MSNKLRPAQYADQRGITTETFDRTGYTAEGPTVPPDGTAGYAAGSIFLKREGAAGAAHYINEGNKAACAFKPLGAQGGMKIARGEGQLSGANPTVIATGLTTIVSAVVTLKRNTPLSTGTAFVTVGFTGSDGTLNVYGWVLAGTASAATENFEWIAIGT